MRILVVSDTHGDAYSLESVVRKHSSAEIIVHCGDGADEAAELKINHPEKLVVSVRGNCDFCTDAPNFEAFSVEGKKIFVTHGHLYGVKGGLYTLSCAAREQGADIVLFGHTHNSLSIYDDGLYLLNPGSLRSYEPTYGLVEVTEKGILTNIVNYDR